MSFIDVADVELQARRIPKRLELLRQLAESAEPIFELEGKRLEQACKEHASQLMTFGTGLQEAKTIEKLAQLQLDAVEGATYKKFNENHGRALSATDIKQYIKGDPQYLAASRLLVEIAHVRQQLELVIKALEDMGWMLSHITKLRIAELSQVELSS